MQAWGLSTTPSKPRMRKCPQRVGRSASATFRTISKAIFLLYVSTGMEIGLQTRRIRCRQANRGMPTTDLRILQINIDCGPKEGGKVGG